ncbi:MAG: FG-GAP repeat domain-containing protein, partial [Bacillota bacterium]
TDGTKSEPAAVLFAIKNGHELNMRLSTIDCKFELKERIRNVPHNAGPPIVADLEGDGTMEIIVCSDNDEIICMEAPRLQEKRPRVRWRMKGLGMAKDAATKQDGVLVSDLDGDGVKEAVFSQETADGQASIIAVEPNGQIKWRHVFKGFDGSKPVWNLGGITYWVAGNFTTMKHQDLYVTIRRNKMHSDVGFLLSGLNGNVLWERDRIEIPNGNLVWDIRGHGGDRIAGADMDQDGIDEIVCAYPDRVFIVNGKKGEPTVIKNTINSLFPEEIAYYAVPVVADFNGDRKPEILYGRSGYLTALLDSGCKLIWKRDYNAAGTNGCNFLQGAGDWDGDGEIEIGGFYKSLAGEGYEFRFYKGLSGDLLAAFPLGTAAPCTDVVTADLDRDGSDEFLFSQGISIICMGNKGIKWSVDTGFTPGDIALADSDADGNLEIIVCTLDGYLKVYN